MDVDLRHATTWTCTPNKGSAHLRIEYLGASEPPSDALPGDSWVNGYEIRERQDDGTWHLVGL